MFGTAGSPSPTRTKSPTSGSPPLLLSESPARTSPHGTPLVPALPALGRRSVRSMSDTDSRLDVRGPPSPTLEVVQGARSHLISPSVYSTTELKVTSSNGCSGGAFAGGARHHPAVALHSATNDARPRITAIPAGGCCGLCVYASRHCQGQQGPVPRSNWRGGRRWPRVSWLVGWLVITLRTVQSLGNYCSPRSGWQQL